VQETLTRRTTERALQAVEDFRLRLERRDGAPVCGRYVQEKGSASAQAK
jgi:hypothetical protein